MSNAEKTLNDANENVNKAVRDLTDVICGRCDGSDRLGDEYMRTVEQCLFKLLDVRRNLNR